MIVSFVSSTVYVGVMFDIVVADGLTAISSIVVCRRSITVAVFSVGIGGSVWVENSVIVGCSVLLRGSEPGELSGSVDICNSVVADSVVCSVVCDSVVVCAAVVSDSVVVKGSVVVGDSVVVCATVVNSSVVVCGSVVVLAVVVGGSVVSGSVVVKGSVVFSDSVVVSGSVVTVVNLWEVVGCSVVVCCSMVVRNSVVNISGSLGAVML